MVDVKDVEDIEAMEVAVTNLVVEKVVLIVARKEGHFSN